MRGEQTLQPFGLHLFGDAVFHSDRRCIWARRVGESVNRVIAGHIEQRHGLLEVFIRLPGKADDDIGCHADVAGGVLDPADTLQVPLAGVLTLHCLEHSGRARLHGEMHVVADGRNRGEAHATDAGQSCNCGKYFREAHAAAGVAVAVYVLAEQLDIGETLVGHAPGLRQDAFRGARTFLAARIGDHAVGTELIAALNDGDVAAMRVRACGELGIESLVRLAIVKAGDAALS